MSEIKPLKIGTIEPRTFVGLGLTQALTPKVSKATCFVELDEATGKSEVAITGNWSGKTLKGVIRALERHYKGIKYSALRQSIKQKQEQEALTKQALKGATNVPATK